MCGRRQSRTTITLAAWNSSTLQPIDPAATDLVAVVECPVDYDVRYLTVRDVQTDPLVRLVRWEER